MTRACAWAVITVALVAAHGCGGPSTGGTEQPAGARGDSVAVPTGDSSLPASPEGSAAADTAPQDVASRPVPDAPPMVPLAAIVAGEVEVGRSVRVEGVCIGYSRVQALGPQPRTRSDWQLVDDTVAVWVVGSYPEACSGTVPSRSAGIYTMTVAMDTLPALGNAPARHRVYLIHTPM
ncbi:MAG TPA: hypothetical protein VLH75_06735 [Longimicrobiales bacterium]|nr:hypothetical protein [Longimicrobiales bacterium]